MNEHARGFRLRTPDGALFPSGRIITDHPERGLARGYASLDALTDGNPDAVIEWPEPEHCVHSRPTHDQHHTSHVDGCPWCTDPSIARTVNTGDAL